MKSFPSLQYCRVSWVFSLFVLSLRSTSARVTSLPVKVLKHLEACPCALSVGPHLVEPSVPSYVPHARRNALP